MSEYFRAADIKAAHRSTTPATLNMINTLFGKNELRGLHKREYAATSESISIKQPHISAGEESSAGAQPILQKSFKGAWGQISPTSEKWLQATLLAKCEADRVRRLASRAKRALFALLATSFCDPPGGASKAGLSPNKFLKISVLSGKMTVYKDSHQKGIEAIHQNKEGGFCT